MLVRASLVGNARKLLYWLPLLGLQEMQEREKCQIICKLLTMNNLLSEIDKEFDEEFCYQNGIDQMIVRYALCQNPKELREDLQIFIHQAVMQYTNLLDKNGKEIYEGDICKCATYASMSSDEKAPELSYEVYFDQGQWRIGGAALYAWNDKAEIIGNIYENPALLSPNK